MDKYEISKKLMKCFPSSFINYQGEFIAHQYANQYFILDNCENETDVKYKVLSWFSRGAHKTEPYKSAKKNKEFHQFMLKGINNYLETNFNEDDMDLIYTYFGNECNKDKCFEFINSNYNMKIFEGIGCKYDK